MSCFKVFAVLSDFLLALTVLGLEPAKHSRHPVFLSYAYEVDRLVLSGGLSTHKHVFKSELKSG